MRLWVVWIVVLLMIIIVQTWQVLLKIPFQYCVTKIQKSNRIKFVNSSIKNDGTMLQYNIHTILC